MFTRPPNHPPWGVGFVVVVLGLHLLTASYLRRLIFFVRVTWISKGAGERIGRRECCRGTRCFHFLALLAHWQLLLPPVVTCHCSHIIAASFAFVILHPGATLYLDQTRTLCAILTTTRK